MNEPIKIDSFLSIGDHLDLTSNELYKCRFINMEDHKEIDKIFKRVIKERTDSLHINDNWKEVYNDK